MTKKQFSYANESHFLGPRKQPETKLCSNSGINQRGSIMWSIIAALIFNYIIMPGWKLTSGDAAKIRCVGSHKNLRRAA
jgi:hypothetical protein